MDDDASHLRLVETLGGTPTGRRPFPLTDETLDRIEAAAVADALWMLNPNAVRAMVLEIRELRARLKTDSPKRIK